MLKNIQKRNNYSQSALACELGVSQQAVSLWENGRCDPPLDVLIKLSQLFNCTIDELVKGENNAKV